MNAPANGEKEHVLSLAPRAGRRDDVTPPFHPLLDADQYSCSRLLRLCRAVRRNRSARNRSARRRGIQLTLRGNGPFSFLQGNSQHFRWSAGTSDFGFNPIKEVYFRGKQGFTQVYAFQLDSSECGQIPAWWGNVGTREKSTWPSSLCRWAVRGPDGQPRTARVRLQNWEPCHREPGGAPAHRAGPNLTSRARHCVPPSKLPQRAKESMVRWQDDRITDIQHRPLLAE